VRRDVTPSASHWCVQLRRFSVRIWFVMNDTVKFIPPWVGSHEPPRHAGIRAGSKRNGKGWRPCQLPDVRSLHERVVRLS